MDACAGQILATELTNNDVDDGLQVGLLLNQVTGPLASFTGDGAWDPEGSTPASPSAIPRRPSSCRRARTQCRAKPPRQHPHSATGTCSPSPSTPNGLAEGIRL